MGLEGIPTPRRLGFREKRSCQRDAGHLPARLQGQQTGGRRAQHSPVYPRRSHLTSGAPKGRKTRVRRQNSAREARLWPHFTGVAWEHRVPRVTISPQVLSRSRAEVGAEPQLPGLRGVERPARLQHNLHIPAERAPCPLECGAEVAGRGCGSPGASQRAKTHRSLPAPVSAQLPNSGTLAKLLRAGGPPRSGPHHRGREGGAVCARTPRRPGGPGRAARRFCVPGQGAQQPIYRRAARGERVAGSRDLRGRRRPPPLAAARWPSPASRLASSGSAAELERGRRRGRFCSPSCCRRAGGRADARSWGPRGGTGGTRRG